MANITEVSQWENVIRQLENGEAATGGADGLANVQAKQLANRTKWLKENYLPLAGGAISGEISCKGLGLADNTYIFSNNSTDVLSVRARPNAYSGALLNLYANNSEKGNGFELAAYNELSESDFGKLLGKHDGSLTWNNTDLAGSAIVAKSLGENGYVKYAGGLIIQWGHHSDVPSKETVITYPISMPYFQSISIEQIDDGLIGGKSIACGKLSPSGFTAKTVQGGATSIRWLAIGY